MNVERGAHGQMSITDGGKMNEKSQNNNTIETYSLVSF